MMDKLIMVYLHIACTATGNLVFANKRPIRSVLAPAETIYNYKTVSPIIVYQSKETTDGNPDDLWIKLDVPNEEFELHLTMNKNLISPKYAKTVFKTRLRNCFYHGTVIGFANWTVVMSTCTGLRGTFGDHKDIDTLYHIEPLERISDEVEQTHIVFDSSELSAENRNGTCGCNDSHRNVLQHMYNFTEPLDRVRRQSVTRIVEWFVINDRRQFIAEGRNLRRTEQRSIEIANVVDMLFAKIGIRVTLVGVETWSHQDRLLFSSNPSTLLHHFIEHLRLRNEKFDSAMLITGSNLDGRTLGVAMLGTMCRGRSAAGVTQDTGSSVAYVGAIAAHELGHIFNMEHDDGRGCTCTGTNNRCIMRATASTPPPVEWSSCSIRDMNNGFARGLGRCLYSERSLTGLDEEECGDGIREGDEACDCGTPALCDDPCCNPHTCQLVNGAVCSTREPCCSECQFKASGTMCRSANDECDIPEYCNGTSGECSPNRYRQNGAECASGQAYCFNGLCQDLNAACNANFAPKDGIASTVGPQKCFNFNTAGTQFGNCGHNYNTFLACASADVRCGQLQCQDSGDFRLSAGTDITVISQSITNRGQRLVQCRSFTSQPGADIRPGLVPEGAKCSFNRFCRNQKCVRRQLIKCPSANSQECSGNGVCNDLDQCSCYSGFTGDTCNSRLTRGRGSHHKEQSQLK